MGRNAPTRASLAARLMSPGIYIWRPPRLLDSLTDCLRPPQGHARDHEGEWRWSWALSWPTPRGASNHVRLLRLRPRIVRRDRSARSSPRCSGASATLWWQERLLRLPVPQLTSFRVQGASVRYLLHCWRACSLPARWKPRRRRCDARGSSSSWPHSKKNRDFARSCNGPVMIPWSKSVSAGLVRVGGRSTKQKTAQRKYFWEGRFFPCPPLRLALKIESV